MPLPNTNDQIGAVPNVDHNVSAIVLYVLWRPTTVAPTFDALKHLDRDLIDEGMKQSMMQRIPMRPTDVCPCGLSGLKWEECCQIKPYVTQCVPDVNYGTPEFDPQKQSGHCALLGK